MAVQLKTLNGYEFNASALGGKAPEYYLSLRNLLDNSDFTNPVNQRGKTSYTSYGYCIDRWIESSAFTIYDGYISTVFMEQFIPVGYTGMHTLAAKRRDGAVMVHTQDIAAAYSYSGEYVRFGTFDEDRIRVTLPTGEYVWAALYPGTYTADTLPPYVPKGYAVELAECQRYYQIRSTADIASVDMRPIMRLKSPTVTAVTDGYAYSANL